MYKLSGELMHVQSLEVFSSSRCVASTFLFSVARETIRSEKVFDTLCGVFVNEV